MSLTEVSSDEYEELDIVSRGKRRNYRTANPEAESDENDVISFKVLTYFIA